MNQFTYFDVLCAVRQWINRNRVDWIKKGIKVKRADNSDSIVLDLEFTNCLAQIVVENAEFAPYRYVSFQSVAISNETSPYYWFDDNKTGIKTILNELDKAICHCLANDMSN